MGCGNQLAETFERDNHPDVRAPWYSQKT